MFLHLPYKFWNCIPITLAASLVQLLDVLGRFCLFTLAITLQHIHRDGGGSGRDARSSLELLCSPLVLRSAQFVCHFRLARACFAWLPDIVGEMVSGMSEVVVAGGTAQCHRVDVLGLAGRDDYHGLSWMDGFRAAGSDDGRGTSNWHC